MNGITFDDVKDEAMVSINKVRYAMTPINARLLLVKLYSLLISTLNTSLFKKLLVLLLSHALAAFLYY